jgi:non-ribosomal peptide synthetase component F
MRKGTVWEQARCRAILTSVESERTCAGIESPSTQIITWEFLDQLPCSGYNDTDTSRIDGIGVVLFTSDSTGTPKGAILNHRALSTSLLDHGAYLGVDASSRMLLFASYAFDAQHWDTWTCLIYGGTVCIPNDSERTNDLQGFINRAQVSIGMLMPAALELLEPDALPPLKKLGVGGDAVTKSHLLPWKNSQTQVFEVYGPTECTVNSSLNTQLRAEDPSDIGKPVGGGLWITDPANANRLLPCGTEGELIITGNHIADGYLDDITKTEAAFVTPTWPDWVPGPRRAYRTGDLAVLDSAGTLRIRGRMDRQIKLNGLRIEQGELEHHLASCELHASLPIVEKVETTPGKHQLVSFFVPRGISATFCAILPPNEALAKVEDAVRERLSREVPAG